MFSAYTQAASGLFDMAADALSLRAFTAPLGAIKGFFVPNEFVWVTTTRTARQVRKAMEKAGVNGWSYIEVVEKDPPARFVVFQCSKKTLAEAQKVAERFKKAEEG
jgi:hypothetical protein